MNEKENKLCKYCKTEINKQAKICPNCKKSQSAFKGIYILYILIALMMIGIIVSVNESTLENGNNVKITPSQNVVENKTINIGDTVNGKDWEISIEEVKFGQRINPPTQPMFYNYYQVDDTNNIYLCIVLNAKNISNLELSSSDVASVKVKYNNGYTYSSFSAIPDKNLGFTYTAITNIKPLTSDKVYYLAEMPKTIEAETDTPIEIEVKFEGKTYIYQYR